MLYTRYDCKETEQQAVVLQKSHVARHVPLHDLLSHSLLYCECMPCHAIMPMFSMKQIPVILFI